jgi:hypothetical protein
LEAAELKVGSRIFSKTARRMLIRALRAVRVRHAIIRARSRMMERTEAPEMLQKTPVQLVVLHWSLTLI